MLGNIRQTIDKLMELLGRKNFAVNINESQRICMENTSFTGDLI
jgi:hypothetical protein